MTPADDPANLELTLLNKALADIALAYARIAELHPTKRQRPTVALIRDRLRQAQATLHAANTAINSRLNSLSCTNCGSRFTPFTLHNDGTLSPSRQGLVIPEPTCATCVPALLQTASTADRAYIRYWQQL